MDRKSGYIRSFSISVSSPSDCSMSGGETGNAPGNAWDGDKMEGACLLLPATERVWAVDQPTDEESVEKREPRKVEEEEVVEEVVVEEEVVVVVVLVGECGSIAAVVVVVVRGLSTSGMLVGGRGAGCKEESAYGTSFTSNGVSTTRWVWSACNRTATQLWHVGG